MVPKPSAYLTITLLNVSVHPVYTRENLAVLKVAVKFNVFPTLTVRRQCLATGKASVAFLFVSPIVVESMQSVLLKITWPCVPVQPDWNQIRIQKLNVLFLIYANLKVVTDRHSVKRWVVKPFVIAQWTPLGILTLLDAELMALVLAVTTIGHLKLLVLMDVV